MKRNLMIALMLVMVFSLLAACGGNADPASVASNNQVIPSASSSVTPTSSSVSMPANSTVTSGALVSKVNDEATLGTYSEKDIEWQTLAIDQENGKALLIAKDCIVVMPYHSADSAEATWETSTLRAWLNAEFYETAFNSEDQLLILETELTTEPNSETGIAGGNDTIDKVFVLSEAEVRKYFATDEAMIAQFGGENVSWWTRTSGINIRSSVCTYKGGDLYTTGNHNDTEGVGVRPAMWISLVSDE